MKDYKIKTYDEAVHIIEEIGILPLAPLIPDYPSLSSMTQKESWHSDTDFDPWIWRTKFSADGVAAYGKFIKKKNVFISREWFPVVRAILGSKYTVNERYNDGYFSKEAYNLYNIIEQEEGIDTRLLRQKSDMKEKEKKKLFDQALVELQGTLDIGISGIKEKQNINGEKNGWSSTSFETIDYWMKKNGLEQDHWEREDAKEKLKHHFLNIGCSEVAMKRIEKIFSLE